MLATELTKEKGGGIVGIIQDITINGNQTTSRSERNRRPGHLLGHVSTSAERSRTSVGISTGTCAGTKFPARCISGGRLESGFFALGSSGGIRKGSFAGQGLKTLRWLTEECVPHIDRTFGVKDREHWLMGYSLAGLFALWAAYESDVFSGIVCCSGFVVVPRTGTIM